jgi:glycosyltransferase involved in cell wall biosynthesis
VGAALEDTNARFHVIGSADGVRKQLGLMREPSDTGFIEDDMPKWHRELGALDVGIVPLASTRFNESKSYLKGLEFAARGVPFVASPLPEYELLAANDIGTICPDRGRSWRSAVARLVNDSVLRDEMAAKGRQIVEEEHTYEVCGEDWIDAWEQAVQNRAAAQRTRAAA